MHADWADDRAQAWDRAAWPYFELSPDRALLGKKFAWPAAGGCRRRSDSHATDPGVELIAASVSGRPHRNALEIVDVLVTIDEEDI